MSQLPVLFFGLEVLIRLIGLLCPNVFSNALGPKCFTFFIHFVASASFLLAHTRQKFFKERNVPKNRCKCVISCLKEHEGKINQRRKENTEF